MFARMFVARRKPMMSTAPMTSVRAVPIPAVTSWRRRSEPARVIGNSPDLLRQLETQQCLHRHLYRSAVDDHRGIAPAPDGIDRRAIEHAWRVRLEHTHVACLAVDIDRELQEHAAGDALRERIFRIVRWR